MPSPISPSLVLNNGMSPSTINSLSWSEIQQLYGDSSATPDRIAFAFALQNNTETDNITLTELKLNVQPKAFWKDVTKDCEVSQGYQSIIITFGLDGTFKVNYQDGETSTSAPDVIDGGSSST